MDATRRKTAFLAAIPFLMALAFWWVHPDLALDADSPRYLAGDPMRTASYPLFLDVAFGPALLPIQLALFAAALSWLAIYSLKFLPLIIVAAIALAIGANPYLWELQATVMSEALTTPILTVIVGCLVGFVIGGHRAPLIAAAMLCGIATSIRPSCLPIIIVPLCAVLLAPHVRQRIKLVALILIAWAAPLVVERLYSKIKHGSELTSPLGRHAFMKAAVIDAPTTLTRSHDPLDRRLVQALNRDFEPIRHTINKAADRDVRYILLTNYEACIAWACGSRIVEGVQRSRPEIDRALFRTGLGRLETNPIGYLKLAATEYHRMWLLHPRKHPDLAPKYNAFLKREGPLPFQTLLSIEGQPTPAEQQKPILRLNRAVFASIGILAALLTIFSACWHRKALNRVAFCLLLGTQAVLVFCALTAVGLPRYVMGMWPMLVAGLLLGALGLLALWKPQLDEHGSRLLRRSVSFW